MWKRRRNFEDGMTEELRFHMEQYSADLVSQGVAPEEAARRARIEFGSLQSVKDDCREARGVDLFDELLRELRYAARLLRKTPGFTATALATLAICLGANLAIFAVMDSILLRPAPFPGVEPAGDHVQQLPESKRGSRRFLAHQLLRTPRPNSRPGVALDLSLRHRNHWRSGIHRARADHLGIAGIFHHSRDRPRFRTRLHRGRDHV